MSLRRVVVTAADVVSCCGNGRDNFFDGLIAAPLTEIPRRVPDFDLTPYFEGRKEIRRVDRFTQFALVAASRALEAAGPLGYDPNRIGTLVGTGVGGMVTYEEQVIIEHEKGPRRVTPFLIPMMMANASSARISMRFGFQGPSETTVSACAASNQSIGNAFNMIRWGRCDAMITGGAEACLTPTGTAGFANMTALSAEGISRPFDANRDGFVMAEGAGILVLEELEGAKARGATILAEVLGYATTADASHITAPSEGGRGAVDCMRFAIEDAGLSPADITYVNAHGTSTPKNDETEALAISKVFGTDPGPAVTSIKGVTGHALGASGALEAISLIESIQRSLIPHTANTTALDPQLSDIDLVINEPREWTAGPAISNSFGFGGHNASIILGPVA